MLHLPAALSSVFSAGPARGNERVSSANGCVLPQEVNGCVLPQEVMLPQEVNGCVLPQEVNGCVLPQEVPCLHALLPFLIVGGRGLRQHRLPSISRFHGTFAYTSEQLN